jgi:hypothetical protein
MLPRDGSSMVFSLVWANIVPNHEAIVSGVVFGDNTVTRSAVVAMGVGIGTIPFFMHVEPVFVPAPIAPLDSLVGLVGDVVRLAFVFKGHSRSAGAVVE